MLLMLDVVYSKYVGAYYKYLIIINIYKFLLTI